MLSLLAAMKLALLVLATPPSFKRRWPTNATTLALLLAIATSCSTARAPAHAALGSRISPAVRRAVVRAGIADDGLSTPASAPGMQELEGYWQFTSIELTAFGGNPAFELRADGTGKMPSRFGKVKSWGIVAKGDDFFLEIRLLDNLKAPMTLRGRLMLSEYFPMVVEKGEVLRIPRTGGEQMPIGEFEFRKIE
ncbi:hypothetical protein T492DRAFT_993365 [Pavlovales sp. CCMP2436]|nr:hypothetical protein T492DRAFT_993365 [Pavlovales sp. CCMP2436]